MSEQTTAFVAEKISTAVSEDGAFIVLRVSMPDKTHADIAVMVEEIPRLMGNLSIALGVSAERRPGEPSNEPTTSPPIRVAHIGASLQCEPGQVIVGFPVGTCTVAFQCPLESLRGVCASLPPLN